MDRGALWATIRWITKSHSNGRKCFLMKVKEESEEVGLKPMYFIPTLPLMGEGWRPSSSAATFSLLSAHSLNRMCFLSTHCVSPMGIVLDSEVNQT